MEAIGEIEIKVEGSVGARKLTPELVDIDEIREILTHASQLLFPAEKRAQRPLVSYELSEGSARHRLRTLMQAVIGFSAVLAQIKESRQINFLHERSAVAIETLQQLAYKKDYVVTIQANSHQLLIDKTTRFIRDEQLWVEAEFYLYGEMVDAGGKTHPNLHLDTEEFGVLSISVDKQVLKQTQENLLYRKFGVRARGKQSMQTFEMDRSSLTFVELLDYDAAYSDEYLNQLARKAQSAWQDVTDPDAWLAEFRQESHA
jgi:hypothetical protein